MDDYDYTLRKFAKLTGREREIIFWKHRDLTNREIAEKFGTSVDSVDTIIGHVYKKFEIGGENQTKFDRLWQKIRAIFEKVFPDEDSLHSPTWKSRVPKPKKPETPPPPPIPPEPTPVPDEPPIPIPVPQPEGVREFIRRRPLVAFLILYLLLAALCSMVNQASRIARTRTPINRIATQTYQVWSAHATETFTVLYDEYYKGQTASPVPTIPSPTPWPTTTLTPVPDDTFLH